jgi:hypothetical protein
MPIGERKGIKGIIRCKKKKKKKEKGNRIKGST